MVIFDCFLVWQVKIGEFILVYVDGIIKYFGKFDLVFNLVMICLIEFGVVGVIVCYFVLGVVEVFMDGCLVIDWGDICDLINLFKGNILWECGGGLNFLLLIKLFGKVVYCVDCVNMVWWLKKNVVYYYDLLDWFYDFFFDVDW